MNVRIESGWDEQLKAEWNKEYFVRLADFVRGEYAKGAAFPPAGKIFAAFDSCPFDNVKVVIL